MNFEFKKTSTRPQLPSEISQTALASNHAHSQTLSHQHTHAHHTHTATTNTDTFTHGIYTGLTH